MNLVHEAMARETTQDDKKPRKENKKNLRARFIATFLTWILLNLIWMYFSHAIAVNEVSKHDRQVNTKYVLDVPNMFGLDRETPVDLDCDFRQKNSSVPIVEIRIFHQVSGGETVLIWEGNSSDEDNCIVEQLTLLPGEHTFETSVTLNGEPIDYPSNYITSEMELGMHLWQPFRTEGFVVANLLGLFLGLIDRAIRGIIRKRKESRVRNMPLHKQRQKEEWEQITHSMAGGNPVDVDDLVGFELQPESESAEMQRKRMRENFAAQAAEADGDTESFVDEEGIEQDDELGRGTTEGLTGKVEHDQNIRTVSDLWRQLSGEDSEKKKRK